MAENLSRTDFHALLEPVGDKILHGAGQEEFNSVEGSDAFISYSSAVPKTRPAVIMTYIQLSKIDPKWGLKLKGQLESLTSNLIVPQIGLAMKDTKAYEGEVAAGKYDHEIQIFCQILKDLNRPAFVRIGYEFNGKWNGYQAESYVLAFKKITRAIRDAGLTEVAIVWDYSPDEQDIDYQPFYPGDSFVDWWAINTFSSHHFTDAASEKFLQDSLVHRKPVMIGESTPRYIGVLSGVEAWNAWFLPYFNFIESHPNIKSFNYINWNWKNYPRWSNWGDAKIQDNAIVNAKFADFLQNNTQMLNQLPHKDLRRALRLSP